MASPLPAVEAIAILRRAGRCVTRTTKADAALRYGCQTCLYAIDGQAVNLGRLRQLAAEALAAEAQAAEATPAPTLPPVSVRQGPGVTAADLRQDAAEGRPVSLATLAAALGREGAAEGGRPPAPTLPPVPLRRPPTGEGWAGQPWDPGAPEARAKVALRGERAGILWPIAQALRGEGVALPPAWHTDGPALNGEWSVSRALAALPLGAIALAATALAALPPVTAAQDAALSLCDTGAVPGRPYL